MSVWSHRSFGAHLPLLVLNWCHKKLLWIPCTFGLYVVYELHLFGLHLVYAWLLWGVHLFFSFSLLDTALQIEGPKLKIPFSSCWLQIHPEKINWAPKASVELKLSNMNHESVLFLPCMVLSCCPKPGVLLGVQ